MHLKRISSLALVVAMLFAANLSAQEAAETETATVEPLPLTTSSSQIEIKPPSIAQQRAQYEADQRMMRMEWNKWIGYSPLRPNMNASYYSNGFQRYYIPSRGVFVSGYQTRTWYW